MVSLAIIGVGGIGRYYLDRVIPKLRGVEVSCLCDVRGEVVKRLAKELGCEYTTDYSKAITSSEVDAILLTTPPFVRLDPIKLAVEYEKHVYCEKPLSNDFTTAKRVFDLVEKSNIKFMVAFVLRYWPVYIIIKEKLINGELGKPIFLHLTDMSYWLHHVEKVPWRGVQRLNSGMAEQLIHEIDIARYLCGDVSEVFAYGVRGCTAMIDYEDHITCLLKFKSGAIGNLVGSFLYRIGDRSGMLVCDEASVYFNARKQYVKIVYSNREVFEKEVGWKENPFLLELRDFIKWIEKDIPPRATIEDSYKAQEIAEAALLSITRDQPIKLPLTWS